jgi:urea carboxylase
MFKKVLIANRGAIACRIIRTLRKMGVASVAVYSDPDAGSLHVSEADEAVRIGAGPAAESYLRADVILAVARQTGAEAIHPGYGFLSESAEFAKACADAGIAFIGPTIANIQDFGLKHTARDLAKAANVPLAAGTDLLQDAAAALKAAESIGYPVILKATAGGGGIGMRVCEDAAALDAAFDRVAIGDRQFSNGGVFLERFVRKARHIEVQVFGDGQGNVVALGERDCSLQRRNQKVIEETPAPNFPAKTRAALLEASLRLMREAKYRSAGTVEFLYDGERDEFAFLGSEHTAAGGAWRDRAGDGRRSGRVDDPRRGRYRLSAAQLPDHQRRHRHHRAGLAGPPAALVHRCPAIRPDGRSVVPPRQPPSRQS